MFNNEELSFLKRQGIVHIKVVDDIPIGVNRFMYTYGLISGYEATVYGKPSHHRFCYPNDMYDLADMFNIAKDWDGKSLPPDGWVKYKGDLGEFTPNERNILDRLL